MGRSNPTREAGVPDCRPVATIRSFRRRRFEHEGTAEVERPRPGETLEQIEIINAERRLIMQTVWRWLRVAGAAADSLAARPSPIRRG